MNTKEIYEQYIEDFTDNIKDYLKRTKAEGTSINPDWRDLLQEVESFRVDILAIINDWSKLRDTQGVTNEN